MVGEGYAQARSESHTGGREEEADMMKDDAYYASRRQFLRTLAASGAIAAADLAWWEDPFLGPRRAGAAASTVRFQFSVPEPLRISLVESLIERFHKSQSEVEVKVEFVPQAQARQKLITAIAAGNPPDLSMMWDNWLGEFDGMGSLEDLTSQIKGWKLYAATTPTAWQTVTVKGKIVSFPWAITNDAVFVRTDRVKEYGLKMPTRDWTWDDFLTLAKGFTKPEKNQYGFGLGVTSMYFHNSGSIEEQKKFVGEPNFATLPIPVGPAKKRNSFYFSETLTMFKAAKNKEGAWKFMTFLMDDEPHFDYCKALGLLPTREALTKRPPYPGAAYAGFVGSFPFSIVSPYLAYPGWGGKIDSEGVPIFQQAFVGKLTPKECLDKFAEMLTKNMM